MSDPAETPERASNFYAKLYTSEDKEDKATEQSFLKGLPKISDQSNERLSGVITLRELQRALRSMECGKAPRLDGLPMDLTSVCFGLT